MPDLLLELFSEEIPARMQARAAADLKKRVTDALVEGGFLYEGAVAYATPRRLTLHVAGLPAKGQDVREEKKGPRVGAPEAAVQGFLKSAGLTSLDQASIESDPKKGEFYVAIIEKPGRPTIEALAEILPAVINDFPWPKSMRWGAASVSGASFRWVRPLRAIVATFGPETEEPDIVPFEIGGVKSGNVTYGHRFHAPGPITVRRLEDYLAKLEAAKVIVDPERRKDIIRTDARNLAFAQGFELVEDEALVDEVAGLVEWPVVLMGEFEESFLAVPGEVIRATIRANQKCFVLRQSAIGNRQSDAARLPAASLPTAPLANRFLATANIEASDGGKTIIAGNGKVIRARLSDALYFWQTDQKPLPGFEGEGKPLDQRLAKIRALNIVFHDKLGTQGQRIDRIKALARHLAPLVGADPLLAERAAELAKADLVTEVVGEFPELQGLMGRYYAALQGEHPSVCAAIEEHYKPQGPSDRVPTDKVSIAVALADKLDTLVGFWAIDEKPTGSKDPYALRRAALGVIRLVVENEIRLKLSVALNRALKTYSTQNNANILATIKAWASPESAQDVSSARLAYNAWTASPLREFFHDRLTVQLREQGARHDLVAAVLAGGGVNDDLLLIVRRVEALGKFLDTEDGKSLLAGFKRAANILRAEEKKDGAVSGPVDPSLFDAPQEKLLHDVLSLASLGAREAAAREDFEGAMIALSAARPAVDAFFEHVTVNADAPDLRRNRLRLLNELRAATLSVADFSKIAG